MIFHQCCVCHLPAAPAHVSRDKVSHGYHKSCFVHYYTHVAPDSEMLEDAAATGYEGALPEVSDEDEVTALKVKPVYHW